MRWPIRLLVACAFSLASLAGAGPLDFWADSAGDAGVGGQSNEADTSQLTQHAGWLGGLQLRGFDIASRADAGTDGPNRFATSQGFVPTAGILSDFKVARLMDDTLNSLSGTSSPIPEPSSVAMLLIGGALVASQLRKL
ncbi:MAG: PEP-CTERM sorting domain-containing protein, partial [bacterium]